MKGLVFDGKRLTECKFEDSYKFLTDAVDGYIEHVVVPAFDSRRIDMWCNEEGKFRSDLETTLVLAHKHKQYDYICGNIAFTRSTPDGETIGLTDEDIKFIKDKFADDGYVINPVLGMATQLLEVV